jgi:hypothetical protein
MYISTFLGRPVMTPLTARLSSDVRVSAVEWLWPLYLGRSKLAILDGDPEVGKSLVSIDLAARLSRGGPLPDGRPLDRPCATLFLTAEDGDEDTVRPRLEAAGADLDRVVLAGGPGGRPPRFPDDLPALEDLVSGLGIDLVVIDPLMAFLPSKVAANLDQSVRQALNPLADLAARTRCAVLLIRHLTKALGTRALYRGQGSMGIVAACRTGLLLAPHPEGPALRVLSVTKSNLGPRPPALGLRVREGTGACAVVEWAGPVAATADELCRSAPPVRMKAKDRATDWLRRELSSGPRRAADLQAAAAEAGIPEATLRRAKADLPASSHRTYDHKTERGEWYWYDPDAPWPADAPFKKPYELPPLPDLDPLRRW